MKVVSAFAATMVALVGMALATNIDVGFMLDGATTYCMGTNDAVETLNFATLEASNVGRCPVGIALTLPSSEFQVNSPITVKWVAKRVQGLTNSIFPNAINAATGRPADVKASAVFACTANTNCATKVPGVPAGADGASTGAFGADGTKALESNTFSLATAGDYVIVGVVALPGDAALKIASEEYVVFKKISVVSDSTSPTGSSNGTGNSSSSSLQSSHTSMTEGALNSGSTTASDSSTTMLPSNSQQTTGQNLLGPPMSATTSSGDGIDGNNVAIISVVVVCCIVGVFGFIFVMRRRKQKLARANKAFGINSSTLASNINESAFSGENDGQISSTYIANVTARNNDMHAADHLMSEESSVAILVSADHGSEFNSRIGNSSHSLPKSSLDTDEYLDKVNNSVTGSSGQAEVDDYHMSNMSTHSPPTSRTQGVSSTSNFGNSAVSARQNKYLQSSDWGDSAPPHMDDRLKSMEQSDAHGFGSIGGVSAVSGLSQDNRTGALSLSEHDMDCDIDFSMSSRPTDDSRATEDLRDTEVSQATGFLEAMHASRLQSEVSARDSYGFRTSRSSVDSYSSGMSSFSRDDSRISGFSVASSLDSPTGSSKY